MQNPMGGGTGSMTPHPPTAKFLVVVIVAAFVVYHFTLGKGRK